MLAFARLMIGQGVQHPAGLPIGLTVTGLYNAHQFSLQPPQPRDPIRDFDNPILRDAVRGAMGSMGCLLQRDQFGNGVEVETELPGMGDKGQLVQLGVAIAALPPARAAGIGQKTTPLIVADRRHLHARAPGERTDGMALHRDYPLKLQSL